MRIASVCFNAGRDQVGGAQVPAYAFKQWCQQLGHQCDFVSAYSGYLSNDIPCPIRRIAEAYHLDNYDAVFFSTFGDFDFHNMTVPFTFMIHAEFDPSNYENGLKRMMQVSELKMCKFVTVIGNDYWSFEKQKLWYPCCMPNYLINGSEKPILNKKGLLYAARISTWKNLHTVAQLSNDFTFSNFIKDIGVFGAANKSEYLDHVMAQNPKFDIDNSVFSVYDVKKIKQRNSKYKYFWDVNGSNQYKIELKRVNLACVEAMKFGCIPIVNMETAPDFMSSFALDISDIRWEISSYANYVDSNHYDHILHMFQNLENSEYSKESVQSMMQNIITGLES